MIMDVFRHGRLSRIFMLYTIVCVACVTGAILLIQNRSNAILSLGKRYAMVSSPMLENALRAAVAEHTWSSRLRTHIYTCHGGHLPAENLDKADSGDSWRVNLMDFGTLAERARNAGLIRYAEQISSGAHRYLESSMRAHLLCMERKEAAERLDLLQARTLANSGRVIRLLEAMFTSIDQSLSIEGEPSRIALQLESRSTREVNEPIWRNQVQKWPVARLLHALGEDVGTLRRAMMFQSASADPAVLDAHLAQIAATLDRITRRLDELKPRLEQLGYAGQVGLLVPLLEQTKSDVIKPDGLIAVFRKLNATEQNLNQEIKTLGEAERRFAEALRGVLEKAKDRNLALKATLKKFLPQVRTTFAVILVGTITFLTTLAAFLIWRVVRPIEAPARAVEKIRRDDDASGSPPCQLAETQDEVGTRSCRATEPFDPPTPAHCQLIDESRARLKRQSARLVAAVESMPQGLYMTDAAGKLLIVNSQFLSMYGLESAGSVTEAAVGDQADISTATLEKATCALVMSSNRRMVLDGWVNQEDRTLSDGRNIIVTTAPTSDGGAVVLHEDVTERRRAQAEIEHLVHHDSLTGLANRTYFTQQLSDLLSRLQAGEELAVLIIGLDSFKAVNDTFGHPVGDQVLVAVGERLTALTNRQDIVARLGGDEFAVVITTNATPTAVANQARAIIERLGEAFAVGDDTVTISASIGISMAPADGGDAFLLMKDSDMALFRAKNDGRAIHRFFKEEMDSFMKERRQLELDLRRAIDDQQMEVHYQPLVTLKSNRVGCFEALLRWRHPERGMISPAMFIPMAEETGLIGRLGAHVLKQACIDAASWPDDICVSVNLSPVQFRTRAIDLDVVAALGMSGLRPNRLELEITEGILLQDTQATLETLHQLKESGVRIVMDDFGTGYSSLSYLRKFSFDKVKIDQSFVRDLETSEDSKAIIRAVTGLCQTLNIATTAEGVETAAQLAYLKRQGCSEAQGYFFARPGPQEEALAFIEQFHGNPFSGARRNTA